MAAADERDETGRRETLNFGHTAGHAFESLSGGRLPHGEAVARGIRFALILSAEKGLLGRADLKYLDGLVDALRLPPAASVRKDFRKFLALISRDKKARGASNRFILLKGPGRPVPAEDINPAPLKKAFEGALK